MLVSESRVRFAVLTQAEIEAYVATGESTDKAGAYGIQGRAGAFVTELHGSYSGVVGLPLYETAQLIRNF
jgi:septum formation protein